MRRYGVFLGVLVGGWLVVAAQSQAVDLNTIFTDNYGFEDSNTTTPFWTATTPNLNYDPAGCEVNPEIIPVGQTVPITAPVGNNFVGILNPDDDNVSCKLAHDSAFGPFAAGTYTVKVWGNRGHLDQTVSGPLKFRLVAHLEPRDGSSPFIPALVAAKDPAELLVVFWAWKAGAQPTIKNASTDVWNRTPNLKQTCRFTNWGATQGVWVTQTCSFVTTATFDYFAISVAGINHKPESYIAIDLE